MKTTKRLTTEQLEDAKRLKALYESKKKTLGITQQYIADEMHITQSAVGHYLNGRNALNISSALIFARILGVEVDEISPTIGKELKEMHVYAKKIDVLMPNKKVSTYPMISWLNAGRWEDEPEPWKLKDADEWLESDASIEGIGFWLRVQGDSMTAQSGISISEGMAILVDTGKVPKNGSLVIAKLKDTNEATFKKYVVDSGRKFLKPLNPSYPLLPINGNCKIIGVVVEAKYRFE